MSTLVLTSRYTPDSNALWKAALALRWQVQRVESYRAPTELKNEEVVLYGEPLFVRIIAEQLGLALYETPHIWLAELPVSYRLREVGLTSLREARRVRERMFIKPATDKSFDARVYNDGSELPSAEYFDDETPTLLSDPVEWEIEYRCFIAQRQLYTCAPYLRNGSALKDDSGVWQSDAPEDDEVVAFVNALLADEMVPLPPAIVIDVGKIKKKGWAVIEANPAWGSGIYGNDPARILETLRYACLKMENVPIELSKWILSV